MKEDYCTFVPDRFKSYDLSGWCYLHDKAYEEEVPKLKADWDFLQWLWVVHKGVALIYYGGVTLFGFYFYYVSRDKEE